ncbi:hypothetical protein [Helicobacter sp.]|uniref:hypothetical protein n=1 Tax=Helicobacter sp. TaxID=218 RepID=UPI0019CE76BC|nr:hypothetical protein [Helicobacter sp.]MBD5165742.1 hypothetical protein [Helicobacter sp.]
MASIASDIDQIIGGDNKLQEYYKQMKQNIMNKKLTLREWIINNGNIINSFLSPTIERYNDFNIDEIVKEFNENKKFCEEFFNHYTNVINAEILPENNLFKAYKEFLEQDKNKNKKQLIIEFLKNNNRAKLRKLFFDE